MTHDTPSAIAMAAIALAFFFLAGDATAQSQEDTATLEIRFEVDTSCTVTTEPVDYGSRVPETGRLSGEGTITVTCPDQLIYRIDLSLGDQPNGNGARRLRNDAGDMLFYNLFQDSGRTVWWGDLDNGQPGKAALGTGSAQVHTVYGDLLQTDDVSGGVYTDTVLVTIDV